MFTDKKCGARGKGRWLSAGLLAFLLVAGLPPGRALAQEVNRAGLIVVDDTGASRAYCVEFTEPEINGYDLLQRAGVATNVEASALGASVCAIDGVGCSFPAESCFCQCQGSPCVYWSYWTLDEAAGWRYATIGALAARVQDGAVQGWRWGAGTVAEAPEPPQMTLEEICAGPAAATAMAAVAAVASNAPTAASTAATPAISATAPVTPAAAGPVSSAQPAVDLLVWLGILAVPLAVGGWLWWRRR